MIQIGVLDTNILIHYFKNSSLVPTIQNYIEQHNIVSTISVVTKAEILSIAKRNNWGSKKLNMLHTLLANLNYFDIEYNNIELMNAYVTIDAFSQGKIPAPNRQMLNNSSRNMGKNDLWIAATAHVLNAVSLTTDNDFDHLHNLFFEVKKF